MTPLAIRPAFAAALLGLLVAGCATTTVQTSGTALRHPMCRADGIKPTAALYWMPQWRADQKEPQVREALAERGVVRFVAQQACLHITDAQRLAGEGGSVPDNAELLGRASEARPVPELAVLVVVRELGPRLLIGLPTLVEGGTEVVIDVRLLRLSTAEMLLDSRIQWRNGGAFVIKGIGSLDTDLAAALSSALEPRPAGP